MYVSSPVSGDRLIRWARSGKKENSTARNFDQLLLELYYSYLHLYLFVFSTLRIEDDVHFSCLYMFFYFGL